MPFGKPLGRREREDLERVAIRILEVERLDAARTGIPIGQPLWSGGRVLHPVRTQPRVCLVHVAHDDRDVLEPAVLTPRIHGNWTPARREVLRELDLLVAELHANDPRT